MIDLKELNKNLDEYLEDATEIDFIFIKSLNDIIIRNTKNREIPKYQQKISLDYAASLVYSFLLNINEEYAMHFKDKLENGTFSFSKNFSKGVSSYDDEKHKSYIQVPITGYILDSYTMAHENMHDMNLDINKNTLCRELLTEDLSNLIEMLFQQFLIKHDLVVQDNRKSMVNNLGIIYDMAWSTDLGLSLITEYLRNGYVGNNFINGLYYVYDENTINNFIYEDYIFKNDFYLRYIIGFVLSFYMYDRIKQNPKFIKELFDINSMINDFPFENILTFLDLDYKTDNDDNLIFTDKSLEKLEKTYKKVLKEF